MHPAGTTCRLSADGLDIEVVENRHSQGVDYLTRIVALLEYPDVPTPLNDWTR